MSDVVAHIPGHCVSCGTRCATVEWFWRVNPEGGYGRPEVLVCDGCMMTDTWKYYRRRKGIQLDGTVNSDLAVDDEDEEEDAA